MKKILILTLSLIFLFSLVACSGGNNGTASDENAGNENTELTLIGSWIHKKTDAEPFKMTLVINKD